MVEGFIAFAWSLEYIFEIGYNVWHCPLAILNIQEGDEDDDDLDEEDDDTDDNRESAKPALLVIVSSPGDRPVYDPDKIDEQWHCHEVPESGFLFDVWVFPEEEDEGEEREVVVWSLEVCEEGEHDYDHE